MQNNENKDPSEIDTFCVLFGAPFVRCRDIQSHLTTSWLSSSSLELPMPLSEKGGTSLLFTERTLSWRLSYKPQHCTGCQSWLDGVHSGREVIRDVFNPATQSSIFMTHCDARKMTLGMWFYRRVGGLFICTSTDTINVKNNLLCVCKGI